MFSKNTQILLIFNFLIIFAIFIISGSTSVLISLISFYVISAIFILRLSKGNNFQRKDLFALYNVSFFFCLHTKSLFFIVVWRIIHIHRKSTGCWVSKFPVISRDFCCCCDEFILRAYELWILSYLSCLSVLTWVTCTSYL